MAWVDGLGPVPMYQCGHEEIVSTEVVKCESLYFTLEQDRDGTLFMDCKDCGATHILSEVTASKPS